MMSSCTEDTKELLMRLLRVAHVSGKWECSIIGFTQILPPPPCIIKIIEGLDPLPPNLMMKYLNEG